MAITARMQEIVLAYNSGEPIGSIAQRYNISEGSVLKKVKSVEAHIKDSSARSYPTTWNNENIKQGIDRFLSENGSLPSAQDFDENAYLPSARQIQRAYGGIVALRKTLGYGDHDFTKGELRGKIAANANRRGISAEDYIEPLLIEKFGEAFVHTQKRYYKGSKNRYDFLIYAWGQTIGVDVFTTDRASYIGKNIRHKIKRYKYAPAQLKIYFVLVGKEHTKADMARARSSISELADYPNMVPVHESEFIEHIGTFTPLSAPEGYISLDTLEK